VSTTDIILPGCRAVPLAHYLKSLAVLRLVSEQADPKARGWFNQDTFMLRSRLTESELLRYFLDEYRPSPVMSPWNGGSGFFANDNRKAFDPIRASTGARFAPYSRAIRVGEHILEGLGLLEKPSKGEKDDLLLDCRAHLPDDAIDWLDAALVLTREGPKYPPLLGTGGNDGRLDFSNNFMSRLVGLIDPRTDLPCEGAETALRGALFEEPADVGLRKAAIGQFLPGHAGGANASSSFEDHSTINPWDFVLMIEGSLLFAAASVRRLETHRQGALAYPFTVRAASVGYGNAASGEEDSSRGELWLPLWRRPSRLVEVRALFSEGRAQVGRRPARDGVDFARAIATLGVDRGIAEFQRYGFHVRNGLAYFATPLNRFSVRRREGAQLLDAIDPWLDQVRRVARSGPSSIGRAYREVERRILAVCGRDDAPRVQTLLVALGGLQGALANSLSFTRRNYLAPMPLLSSRWAAAADDGSAEYRLASALACAGGKYGKRFLSLRDQVEPVEWHGSRLAGRLVWRPEAGREVVPETGGTVAWLNRIMERRIVQAVASGCTSWPDSSRFSAALPDVAAFIEGGTDDRRLAILLRGLLLLDWRRVAREDLPRPVRGSRRAPDALYALLKLCFAGREVRGTSIPIVTAIHTRAAAGVGGRAAEMAVRRLRGSGKPPSIGGIGREGVQVQRTAAALLFPLGRWEIERLADQVLKKEKAPAESAMQGGEGEEGCSTR